MSDNQLALTDEEIAERLATFMGWRKTFDGWISPQTGWTPFSQWNPANNIAQCWLIQAEIERLGLLEKWGEELAKSHLCGDRELSDSGKIANASARERCLARSEEHTSELQSQSN